MGYNIPAVCFSEISASALIMLLLLCRQKAEFGAPTARKLFNCILILALVCPLVELCSYLVLGRTETYMIAASWILSALAYIFLATDAVLWAAYSNARVHGSWEHVLRRKVFLIPYAVDILLIATTPLTKLVFTITPENFYIRGPFVWVTYIVALFYIGLSIYTSIRAILRSLEARIFPFIYFTILAILGMTLQTVFSNMAFMWFCINAGLVMVHIQWQNELTYRDSMTGMLNRRGLFNTLSRIKRQNRDYCGIMADINSFKDVNDTYGHAAGDAAIAAVANIFSDAADGNWLLIRYGGDEFVALRPHAGKNEAVGLAREIERRLSELNSSGTFPFTLSLSIGEAVISADDKDTDRFLRELDDSMYSQKGTR